MVGFSQLMSVFLQSSLLSKHAAYFSSKSYESVVDEFRLKYPDDLVPKNSTITTLITWFREFESISNKRTRRPAVLTDSELDEVKNTMLCSKV